MELFGLYRTVGDGTRQLICASHEINKLKEHIIKNDSNKYETAPLFLPFTINENNTFVSIDADFEGFDIYYDCNQYFSDITTAKYEENKLNRNERRTYLSRIIKVI